MTQNNHTTKKKYLDMTVVVAYYFVVKMKYRILIFINFINVGTVFKCLDIISG